MKNKNQIGPGNEVETYGLYLVSVDEAKCIKRSDDKRELIEFMHFLAKNNSLYYGKEKKFEGFSYEVRDDSWSYIYVVDSCGVYED